jgi:VanZ family protein
MKNQASQPHPACADWSNRILIASLIGIVFLTLFPFQFDFTPSRSLHRSPLLLGASAKPNAHFDFFLNVLLFIPFGFGFSAQLHKRGWKRISAVLVAVLAGSITSYAVEVLQFYIPTRNSGWDDVISNSAGVLAGFFIFVICGDSILRQLSEYEDALENWISPRRAAAMLLVYFGVWFGISIFLQKETRLSNWDAQCSLFVGNDASGQHAWMGQVFRLQIWNRALPAEQISRMMARDPGADAEAGTLAFYEFTVPPPYSDQRKVLPELSWMPSAPSINEMHVLETDGRSWLGTKISVMDLNHGIQKANQFTFHVVCAPAKIQDGEGRIVSISQSADNVNLSLRQEKTSLVLYFRNPLSETRSNLVWYVPHVFEAGQVRDIFASYDGSDASLYVDGRKALRSYHLGPGAALQHSFFFVRTDDLEGYVVAYETLVFLPIGLLIGLAARKCSIQKIFGRSVLALGLFLPPVLLELLLVWVSGRGILVENVFLSLLVAVAGCILINADFLTTSLKAPPEL